MSVRPTWHAVTRRLPLPRDRIRWKIVVPYAVLSLVLALGGTYLVTRIVAGSLEERFHNQLAEAARVASDSVVRREQEHLATLRAVAFTDGMAEAVEDRDAARLERLVLPIAVNAGASWVEVLDASGRRLYSARRVPGEELRYETSTEPAERAAWAPVADVLAGRIETGDDKFAALVPEDGTSALVTAGPIAVEGGLVGVVVVATPLPALLAEIKSEALSDLAVYHLDGSFAGSTLPVGAQDAPAAGAAGELRHATLFGREYAFLAGDLRVRGERAGTLTVALSTSFIASANNLTRDQLAAMFSLATLAILGTGWLLARALTAPLLRLANTARAVAAGDLSARSGVRGRDEIGVLASTFDTMTERVRRQHLGTIGAMVSAIDARDPYTRGHSVRVGHLAVEIGSALGLAGVQLQHLQVGGYLHDVGKIGVRDAVLLKTGALSDKERALIEEHPRIGLDILATVELPDEVRAIVGGHHERLNGTGYPLALSAEELSIFPRIAAVADVYDALVTDRPYRAGMAPAEALRLLRRESLSGGLDAEVVSTMEQLAERWEQRRHDDPVLQGFSLEGRLYVPPSAKAGARPEGRADSSSIGHPHPHRHAEEHQHAS